MTLISGQVTPEIPHFSSIDTLKNHILDQYPSSLTSEQISHAFDIRSGIDWKRLINRFQELTSVKFTKQANSNLCRYLPGNSFLLFEPDIKKIGVSVSHLSVIYHAGMFSFFSQYFSPNNFLSGVIFLFF
jgi:hypothetical protein